MDLYAENILDHYRHPRHSGELPGATVDHEEWNHACGDSLHVWVRLGEDRSLRVSPLLDSAPLREEPHSKRTLSKGANREAEGRRAGSLEENSIIQKISWTGTGCAISQASMSLLSEELAGMKIEDVLSMSPQHMYDMLSVPIGPRRFKCALMSLHTVKNALRKAGGLPPQDWIETVGVGEE